LKVSTDEVCVFVTSRAALIWSFRAIMAPLPFASGATQMRAALKRLRGPSKSFSEALRWAPMRTMGLSLFTVRSRNQAVSSSVSVPCETMTPATSGRPSASSAARASSTQRGGSM